MTHRFWIAIALAIPVIVLGMAAMLPGMPLMRVIPMRAVGWVEFALSTPVVLWCGWPFFQRGWVSIVTRNLNMFTLIAIGTGTAYVYSVAAVLFPGAFSVSFRAATGEVAALFRSRRGIYRARPARTGARASRSQPHIFCHSRIAEAFAQDRAPRSRRRHRN